MSYQPNLVEGLDNKLVLNCCLAQEFESIDIQ